MPAGDPKAKVLKYLLIRIYFLSNIFDPKLADNAQKLKIICDGFLRNPNINLKWYMMFSKLAQILCYHHQEM